MNIEMLTDFFMWCTIINIGLMLPSSVMLILLGDFVYRIHTKWFPMPRETFNVVLYSFLGFYKVLIFVFNIVPWLALLIIK